MAFFKKLYEFLENKIYRWVVYPTFPRVDAIKEPAFIVGSARSGTTILGRLLEQHPKIAYLNEPGRIWHYEPRTGIWSRHARRRGGRLRFGAGDIPPKKAARIKRAFAVEQWLQNGEILVEKLPVNSYRIPMLLDLFPDARFIHMLRDGIEVAYSIAECFTNRIWWRGIKWELLAETARDQGDEELLQYCTNPVHKGLLEWRLATQSVRRAFDELPADRCLDVRYEQLVEVPLHVCAQLERFLGVELASEMHEFAMNQISRRSPRRDYVPLTPAMEQMAGDLLVELGYEHHDTSHV